MQHVSQLVCRLSVVGLLVALLVACGGDSSIDDPATVTATATTPAPPATEAATVAATVDLTSRFAPAPGRALLEPESGAYFGVNLDWDNDSAAAFNARLGAAAAAYVQFAPFPLDAAWRDILQDYIDQVRAVQGLAVLTLEPTIPLEQIDDALAQDLAALLRSYNEQGVGVLLRFAHEMNGSWYPWSQQPVVYVAAFQRVAAAVHAIAPGTAMLWAPNYGGGYPFAAGPYEARPGAPGFELLDTTGDGVLDAQDDPYAPYYPGDDAVDWVGLSLYHWGSAYPWGENEIPEEGKFVAQIAGSYDGFNGDDRQVPDFYATFVEGHGKPMAIVETAALYQPGQPGPDELAIKQAWWRQVFAPEVAERFPRIAMINWFEWRKSESEIGGAIIDWTATRTEAIRAAFVADLPRDRLRFAPAP